MRILIDPDRLPPIAAPPVAAETGDIVAPVTPPAGHSEPPAHWLQAVQSAGPPAHWIEKVRTGAPHLLPPEQQVPILPTPEPAPPVGSDAVAQAPARPPVAPAAFAPVRQPLAAPAGGVAAPQTSSIPRQDHTSAPLVAPHADPPAVPPAPRHAISSASERSAPARPTFPLPLRASVRAARFQQIASAAPPVSTSSASAAPALPSPTPAPTATTPPADVEHAARGQSVFTAPGSSVQLAAPLARPPDTPSVTASTVAEVAEVAPPVKLEALPPAFSAQLAAPPPNAPETMRGAASSVTDAAPPVEQDETARPAAFAPMPVLSRVDATASAVRLRPTPEAHYPAAGDPHAPPPVESWRFVRTARPPAASAPTAAAQRWPVLIEASAPERVSPELLLRAQVRQQRLDREQRGEAWNA